MGKYRKKTIKCRIDLRKSNIDLQRILFRKRIDMPTLPTPKKPEVICYLSKEEVAVIPKDKYVVRRVASAPTIKDGYSREEKNAYIIKLAAKIVETATEERDAARKQLRKRRGGGGGGGGGTPPSSNIFHRFIDEDKMSDCILHIIDGYFHGGDKCTICEVDLNLYDFSLLMHFYFGYIKILAKDSQLAYCTYLKNKVFSGEDKVSVRNFNIYAKKSIYTKFKKLLEEDDSISFDSRPTTTPSIIAKLLRQGKTLLSPFQEIGWKFQYSPYFTELRKERKELEDMKF